MLIGDFLNNYFAFDSKIFRSFKPFLLSPGFLTNQYNIGKRESYIHPLRLYLVISLFYFFILSIMLGAEMDEQPFQYGMQNDADTTLVSDGVLADVQEQLDSLQQVEEGIGKGNTKGTNKAKTMSNRSNGRRELSLMKNSEISDEALLDSLAIKHPTPFKLFAVHQARKVVSGDIKPFFLFAIKNFPIMMFLVLPVFALILLLLYFGSGKLYVMHLIHALHLHSFAYLIYGLAILLSFIFSSTSLLFLMSFLLVSVYTYISFVKVYEQKYFKTFVKFFLVGALYVFCLTLFAGAELMISFFLF